MNAIEIKDMSKVFRIPHKKKTTVFESVTCLGKKTTYETIYALKDINLTVRKGETLGIIGLNGSGKTTLLKLIAGILEPSEGTIRVNGKVSPFLELGVGFQGDLTAKENIYLYGAVMGLSKKDIDKRFDKIIKFAGFEKFVDTELKNYSDGMRVRLAFSTAIETRGEIFLMDEVLAVGDIEFRDKSFKVLERFKKEEKTILFVSHNLNFVRSICDRLILLDNGRINWEGNKAINKYKKLFGTRLVIG